MGAILQLTQQAECLHLPKIPSADTGTFYIVYDNETKVMYAVSDGHYNRGVLTMLVNADGTPKIYEGE